MDYAGGVTLNHWQWQDIHLPKSVRFKWLQDEAGAESASITNDQEIIDDIIEKLRCAKTSGRSVVHIVIKDAYTVVSSLTSISMNNQSVSSNLRDENMDGKVGLVIDGLNMVSAYLSSKPAYSEDEKNKVKALRDKLIILINGNVIY